MTLIQNDIANIQEKDVTITEQPIIPYLEFGSIDLAHIKKQVYDFKIKDKAYDWFMLGRYANDLLMYKKLNQIIDVEPLLNVIEYYQKEIHHKRDFSQNLDKLTGLKILASRNSDSINFYELGQTIFGCIEAIEFCQNLIAFLKIESNSLNLNQIKWYGKDISEYFNQLSVLFHPKHIIHTSKTDPQNIDYQNTLFYAKGITLLYAIDSIPKLFKCLTNSTLAIFDYSFSLDGDKQENIGTGVPTYYLDYNNFIKNIPNNSKIYIRKNKSYYNQNTKKLYIEAICGSEEICQQFIQQDQNTRTKMKTLNPIYPHMNLLCDLDAKENCVWENILDFAI